MQGTRIAKLEEFLKDAGTVAIAGHVNPDGDCIGSCMGMYLYIRDNYPEIRATVYLEPYREVFSILEGIEEAKDTCEPEPVDLLILLDISSRNRIGVASPLLDTARKTICLDHHVTNRGTYTWFHNEPETSSASEVLFGFLDPEKISPACAAALYTGIVNDTGVFQYASTTPETMRTAALLMEKGAPFSKIIDVTFFQKSHGQNRIMGKVLQESRLLFDGRVIIGCASQEDMKEYHVEAKEMDGIVSELRNTIGVDVAVFLYEMREGCVKVSLRSREYTDVSRVAQALGGGGHIRAAGCNVDGTLEEVEAIVVAELEKNLS